MLEQLADRGGGGVRGEIGEIGIRRGVEIERTGFDLLHHQHRHHLLGDRGPRPFFLR